MKDLTDSAFLNYHHLRYFWAVAREGSLRKASETLRVSQPSISTQIGLLESTLGENLFRPRGRSLELTEFGRRIYEHAEEIFSLGREILRASREVPGTRPLRLHAGIVDSFPKLMTSEVLRPVFTHKPAVNLVCHEGKLEDLVGMLASHRMDVVLSDEPVSASGGGRVFNHLLGTTDVTFCAMPSFTKGLKGRFPRNLDSAPAILPTQNCTLRRELERWFTENGIQPRVVAELEDSALGKIVASEGVGFTAIPTVVVSDAIERYGFVKLGRTRSVQIRLYAITAQRRFSHPALKSIIPAADSGGNPSPRAPKAVSQEK